MPRLLLFAPCRMPIINERDNSLSLVGVLDGITVPANAIAAESQEIRAPMDWAIVSVWRTAPEEGNKSFEQKTQLFLPDGSGSAESTLGFQCTERTQRNVVYVYGFPITQPGEYILRLYIREAGQNLPWNPVAEYPLTVTHSERQETK